MSNRQIQVLGAGGHAKVLIQMARADGWEPIYVFDDTPEKWGTDFMGIRVSGAFTAAKSIPSLLAIGDNCARMRISEKLKLPWLTLIHHSAIVDSTVKIGGGTVLMAGTVIQPDTIIGNLCIINTGSTVDHDGIIGDYVHIAPGSHTCGNVHIGEGVLLGAGCTVTPKCRIGRWSIVGAGATVIHNVDSNSTVIGTPAKEKKSVTQ